MKVYTTTDFKGHWPVGTAAVVVAHDEIEATTLLQIELEKRGLTPDRNKGFTLTEVDLSTAGAIVLCDGDY